MTRLLLAFLAWCRAFFCSRHDLGLELAALRQQAENPTWEPPESTASSLKLGFEISECTVGRSDANFRVMQRLACLLQHVVRGVKGAYLASSGMFIPSKVADRT
jgi:hypothetical protein